MTSSLRLAGLLTLLLAAACAKESARAVAAGSAGTVVDAGVPTSERVVFTGAVAWSGGRACSDVSATDGCDSQWLHASGQVVRVFVIPVKDPAALLAFVDKLAADVVAQGGIVDRMTQDGLTLVRFLQAMVSDGGVEDIATINYALVGRDQREVHLITSVVPFAEQQAADARLRELLTFAAWTARTP